MEKGFLTAIPWRINKEACLGVMDKLLSLPCAHIFNEPIMCHSLRTAKPPRRLSFHLIRQNLRNNEYIAMKDWILDMWDYFKAFGEKAQSPAVKALCTEYFTRFKCYLHKANELCESKTSLGWLKDLLRLQLKLENLLRNAPPPAQPYMPYPPQVKSTTMWVNKPQVVFLKEMLPRVHNPLDLLKLTTILESGTIFDLVEEDGTLRVSDTRLNQRTACQVFDFLQNIFPEESPGGPKPEDGRTARPPRI